MKVLSYGLLSIGSINIQIGMRRKISAGDIDNLLKPYDIFCMQETWLTESTSFTISGYHHYSGERIKRKSKGRNSGGVITFFKHAVEVGLTKLGSQNRDCLWVKLDTTFFGLNTDIYRCNTYLGPFHTRKLRRRNSRNFGTFQV